MKQRRFHEIEGMYQHLKNKEGLDPQEIWKRLYIAYYVLDVNNWWQIRGDKFESKTTNKKYRRN